MNKRVRLLLLFVGILFFEYTIKAEVPLSPLNEKDIERTKSILTTHVTGYGEPITNRKVWDKLAKEPDNVKIIEMAERMNDGPFPQWQDSLILKYETTGIREDADIMMSNRSNRLAPNVIAECLENKGRFIPAIEYALKELCSQPTWVLVAHDPHLDSFKGKSYHVDLSAATLADNMGQTLYLLGNKLNPDIVKLVRQTLQKRVFEPVLYSYRTLDCMRTKQSWITRENNWNLVCLAGVTCSALAVIDDINLRAEFVTAAEKYIQYGINGFLADGYCVEGIGYFNYGFSYFIHLREGLYRATNGSLDLFTVPKIAKVATFGSRSEIINHIYPAISDCRINTTPSEWILWYTNRSFGWKKSKNTIPFSANVSLLDNLIAAFSESTCRKSKYEDDRRIGVRTFFDKANVLICRPSKRPSRPALGICIKGGSNHESHNHNDVGSYTVVAGNELMMGDMGGPSVYTKKTFSKERYTLYPSFSSYGHPLPLYDGQQQIAGQHTDCLLLSKQFNQEKDVVLYDIRPAYEIDYLRKATRLFEYNRKQNGMLTVTDCFVSDIDISFETAITTRQKVEVKGNIIYLIGTHNRVEVIINSSLPVSIFQSTISDYAMVPFTRIGIRMNGKLKEGSIKLQYKQL